MIIRLFSVPDEDQVLCISYDFKKYACSPKAITEFLLSNGSQYKIYWAFNKDVDVSLIDKRIYVVRKWSYAYLRALYTSKFIINNSRNKQYETMFIKKSGQKYIQTWHGSFALKKIEKDVSDQLGAKYVKQAMLDSRMCDIMPSNSRLYSDLIRKSFWYDGEILEKCMPRNDIYYNSAIQYDTNKKIREKYGFSNDTLVILYAPTFRNDKSPEFYKLNWDSIISSFQDKYSKNTEIFVRLHPNVSNIGGIDEITDHPHIHDVTQAPDIVDYLFVADYMISDYTSAMFDFALLGKPCFIYATDKDEYDRGFYWTFDQLPFPFAETEEQLVNNIKNFSISEYHKDLNNFKNNIWGVDEDGRGCERLYNWMLNN